MKPLSIAVGLAGLYAFGYWKKGQDVELRYFKPSEFGVWWPQMDSNLLTGLDEFRHELGKPVSISPANGSLGRVGASNSYHNVAKHGKVMAADVMFPWADEDDLKAIYEVAKSIKKFGGIGVYPHWQPYVGLHLDTRPISVHNPATWAGLDDYKGKQYYTSVENAFA